MSKKAVVVLCHNEWDRKVIPVVCDSLDEIADEMDHILNESQVAELKEKGVFIMDEYEWYELKKDED